MSADNFDVIHEFTCDIWSSLFCRNSQASLTTSSSRRTRPVILCGTKDSFYIITLIFLITFIDINSFLLKVMELKIRFLTCKWIILVVFGPFLVLPMLYWHPNTLFDKSTYVLRTYYQFKTTPRFIWSFLITIIDRK